MKEGIDFTFIGGRKRQVTIAATAGNVAKDIVPGTGRRWRIIYGVITLQNDATIAARNIILTIKDAVGGNIVLYLGYTTNAIANQKTILSLNVTQRILTGFTDSEMTAAVTPSVTCNDNFILEGLESLNITIAGGVAGDSYSGYLEVLEVAI